MSRPDVSFVRLSVGACLALLAWMSPLTAMLAVSVWLSWRVVARERARAAARASERKEAE